MVFFQRTCLKALDFKGLKVLDLKGLKLLDLKGLKVLDLKGLKVLDLKGLKVLDLKGLKVLKLPGKKFYCSRPDLFQGSRWVKICTSFKTTGSRLSTIPRTKFRRQIILDSLFILVREKMLPTSKWIQINAMLKLCLHVRFCCAF
jgi:hypothetical protein